jgi:outer membrane protein TolC
VTDPQMLRVRVPKPHAPAGRDPDLDCLRYRGSGAGVAWSARARSRPMRLTQYRTGVASAACWLVLVGNAHAESLSLEDAVTKSLAITEDVRIARARRVEADGAVGVARSALFPDLVATGTYTRRSREVTRGEGAEEVTVQTANAVAGNVTVSSTVFDARALPLLRAAKRERDAVEEDEKDQIRRTGFVTADAFLVALGQERIVAAATERRDFAQARQREVAVRVQNQLTGRNDLTQADLELATAERELTAATGALADAYAQLAYQIGEPVTGPLVEPTWLYDRASGASDPTGTAARPDVAAAKLRVESAAELAKEPERRIFPTIGVFGQVRFTNEPGFSGRNADWSVGVTATWEIWDGGERAADARAADARTEIAKLAASSLERRAASEVESAAIRLRTARADVAASTTLAETASRNADEIAVLYDQGLVRALELTDAGSRRFEAEVARVRATIGVAAAYLDLVAATGASWLPEASR